jgi:hypothetical protein
MAFDFGFIENDIREYQVEKRGPDRGNSAELNENASYVDVQTGTNDLEKSILL